MDLILKPVVVETPKILQNQQIYVHTKPTITKVRIGKVETLEPDNQAYVKSTQYSDETVLDIGIPKGFVGAKIVDVELIDENETGIIYKFLFDDGQSVEILSPRGPKGDKGGAFDLGEVAGTAYEGNKGKANADATVSNTMDIHNILKEQYEQNSQIEATNKEVRSIKQALLQNEILVVSKTENKTTTRITAGGENIVDEQYTPVTEIKGSTVKDENLIPFPYTWGSHSDRGVTFTVNDDGSVTIQTDASGATETAYFFLNSRQSLSAGTYYLGGCPKPESGTPYYIRLQETGQSPFDDLGNGNAFTTTKSAVYVLTIDVRAGAVITNPITIKPVLCSGSAARPFIPRFTGLKHAYFKSIKSTGRNIVDSSLLLQGSGWTETDGVYTGWASSLLNMTFFENVNGYTTPMAVSLTAKNVQERNSLHVNVEYTDGSLGSLVQVKSTKWTQYSDTTNSSKVVKRIYGTYGYGDEVSIKDFYIGYGTNSEYELYKEEIYQLPKTLELAEYDSFNPQTGELTKQTRRLVVDGVDTKLNIQDMNTYWLGLSYLSNYNGETQNQVIANNGFGIGSFDSSKSKGVYLTNTGNTHIAVWFNKTLFTEADVSTADKMNAYLKSLADAGNPLTVEYKLATPTIEQIENVPKQYTAWNKGSETIIQGTIDNSEYEAIPTVTNEYILKLGGEE